MLDYTGLEGFLQEGWLALINLFHQAEFSSRHLVPLTPSFFFCRMYHLNHSYRRQKIAARRARFSTILVSVSLVAIIMAAGVLGYIITKTEREVTVTKFLLSDLIELREEMDSKLLSVQKLVSRIQANIDTITSLPQEAKEYLDLEKIRAEIQEQKQTLDTLNSIIIENPEKALSIPLLRKDIEMLRKDMEEINLSVIKQIDRVYDFSKWFIWVIIAIIIGIGGIAVSTLLKPT